MNSVKVLMINVIQTLKILIRVVVRCAKTCQDNDFQSKSLQSKVMKELYVRDLFFLRRFFLTYFIFIMLTINHLIFWS